MSAISAVLLVKNVVLTLTYAQAAEVIYFIQKVIIFVSIVVRLVHTS
jgi:hypothetical protein